ncbi:pyridoxal phosphate-dependent aminotransferase [Poseidonocella sedimentorum]|uniref:Aminotransferase n=1 Tax=Poseidonocella sedimentorum TaxID=871652 RepID=A0A1I6DH15_9RHOB|nr:aminotransferase class I/II-fold pyridoxal phosphate-dependent enzyme [Poseidonocella sedimentorum]SFR04612.1 arginine:pyruvate transaminase [Poseidonocella sedimentorum]
MRVSARVSGINGGGSDGWEVFGLARQMIAMGHDVVELTIGEHDIRTDPRILEAMHDAARGGATGYAGIRGIAPLREEVARRVSARTGVETAPEEVLITPGGQAALFAAHMAACDAGARALFVDPYYATYPGTIRSAGAVPVPVAAGPEDGFLPRGAALRGPARDAASLLINTPNNPTGAVYPRQTLEEIAEVCREADLWLISDEVYDTQVWRGAHLSPRALPGMAERTLVVGSMSKSHAMTGSRIGWLVAPEPVIDALSNLATNTTYGVAGFVQRAALFALRAGSELEDEIAAPFRRRDARAREILGRSAVLRVVPGDGAMYVMVDVRRTGLSGDAFARGLLEAHRIAVMPGESFGAAAAGHVRIALTVADDVLCRALETLVQYADRRADAA